MKVDMNIDMGSFIQECEATISRVSRRTCIAAQEGGNTILRIAQAKCPRFTGTLMNSGIVAVEGSSKDNYAHGFSSTISFGGGNNVNPITGQHPSEYAAAVHEGFAMNPITGEMSKYRSGEPKFLERAVRVFEESGLHKVAYTHWKQAIYPGGDDFYAPIGTINAAERLVDDAMMKRMGADWWGLTGQTRSGSRYDAAYGYKRFADTREMKADPKVLYKARALSDKMASPSDLSLTKRPESLYRRGRYDTIKELAVYLNDLSWGGAEFANARAAESIIALANKYTKAGWKLTGKDALYDAYRRTRKIK